MAPTDADKAVMDPKDDSGLSEGPGEVALDERANASGHVQELDRNFSLLNAVGVALLVGSVWPAFGGTILTSLVPHTLILRNDTDTDEQVVQWRATWCYLRIYSRIDILLGHCCFHRRAGVSYTELRRSVSLGLSNARQFMG